MESVLLVAPITALEFIGDYLLAGEGPNLTVYSIKANGTNRPRIQQNVLGGYTIHGIKPTSASCQAQDVCQLCVFGSKGLTVLEFSITDQHVNLSQVCCLRCLHDWIWDVQWLHEGPQTATYLGLALGHNSVALYDYKSGRVLKEVHCAEKCILYSAHFVGKTWQELTLISGTVFNQLVIWGMCDQTNGEGRVEPRRRISGHQGVIFSIFYEKVKGMLASASDDRSLRVWKAGDLADSESDIQCLLVLYGHQSRVWSVRLLQENIVSIGEDSACIIWNYTGDIVQNFKGHKGRGIRAVAVQDQLGWVATGGADSGIRIWQIKGRAPSSNGLVNLNFNSSERIGVPKAIAMIDTSCLLVMTDVGSIYMNDLLSNQWTFVLADEAYRSYSLLDVFKSSTNILCAIGNIAGGVKIFSVPFSGSCPELKLYDGKVHSLTWVPSPCLSPDRCHLFISGPNGVMNWLEVAFISGKIHSISEKGCFNLPTCKQRWHTSIAFVPTENVIVCGDRRGSLMLLSMKVTGICQGNDATGTPSTSDCPPSTGSSVDLEGCLFPMVFSLPEQREDPVSVLYGIHGKLGVTSVTYHDGFVYSTGRDGLYRQLKIEGGQLILLRKLKSCKGMEWIERLLFMRDGNLQILGFHSTDFVVWSAKTNEKLLCVPCGGGHRSWSYKKKGPREVFAYIKTGDVFAYQSQPLETLQSVLKEPLHGRELTCIKYAGNVKLKEKRIRILITSSEDTTVNVLAFNEVSKEIWQISTISDHLSSVRTLALAKTNSQSLENGILSCVLFTAGGRAQIECYRLLVQAQEDEGQVTCQVIHLASHRLDEHWDRMKNKHRMIKVDPETRYMCIRALDDVVLGRSSSGLFLAAACSDGSVRFFMMCEDLRKMILVAETFYHQRCVMKVEAFVHRSADSDRVWLCSASTDGRIAFWDVTSTVGCAHKLLDNEYTDGRPWDLGSACFTLSAHQCGINSLHIRNTMEGQFLLASGGDDNSIHVCKLELDGKSKDGQTGGVRLLQSFSITSAHAAHVTGLRILRHDLLASASVDQRLTLWNLSADGLQHLTTRFCHVADVSDLDCWTSGGGGHWCVLCGQGLEIVVCKHST
ncbi:WD repeat-containing protein 6 [Rana temporaria]|uniref:WD repeat-containing protein 6 n=1 Tax=Rana temporaria TaxID=8407 RepID=UPI001AAD495B|nr:WD repeat-containing protein 6 [Rana temporaria]XP_040214862.1 WD repeat-containing protein 6 [Rana temporaria]XP_040214863.1 WD repeat-containing protein 6 [Rana temporaria]XP_040214864.1 WD repeat-containing protein 6 [Rana temporaria]